MSDIVSLDPSQKKSLSGDRQGLETIRIVGNAYQQQATPNNFFNRSELEAIMQVYSRQVMAGEWLDYAIGERDDGGAIFEIYGQVAAWPSFTVIKRARSFRRMGRYQVADRHRVLKTAKTLEAVLKVIDVKKPRLVESWD